MHFPLFNKAAEYSCRLIGLFAKRVMPRAFYYAQPAVGYQAFYNFGVRQGGGGIVFAPYKQRGAGNIAYNTPQIGIYK